MAVTLKSLKADLKAQNEGDWVSAADMKGMDEDVAFKVRALSYEGFQKRRMTEAKRLEAKYGADAPADETFKAFGRALASEILLDWKGFADAEYTPDVAMDALCDPALADLQNAVVACAARMADRKVAFTETATKN